MKILIATGIYPPDIGGPAQYARGVEEAWKKQGHEVTVLAFSAVCRTGALSWKLPTGIRHLCYFFCVLFSLRGVDFVFSPDTFSAALPALCAAKLCGKKVIVRTGGDFLWEQYVERTGDLVLLRNFYGNTNYETDTKVRKETRLKRLSMKEWLVFRLVRFLFRNADAIIFSTAWQRNIFERPYRLDLKKCFIVENYYEGKAHATPIIQIHPNMPNKKEAIVEKELSYKLGSVFFDVHNESGRFCRERQYADLLAHKLQEKGLHFIRELPITVAGRKSNFADFVVENRIIVEVKAVPFIGKEEYYQVMRYLEAMDLELGLVVNFSNRYLKPHRVLNPKYSKRKCDPNIPNASEYAEWQKNYLVNSGVNSDSSGRSKVFVGGVRDLKWKNMPRLKEAFERVQNKGLPVQLQWETGSRAQFLSDIQSSYAVILASLGDISPHTILEAIQFGKPFILTRETGLYDKLKGIGVWVNPEDVSDIAEKILWLADERNYEQQKKKVEAFSFTHSYEEIANEILEVFHKRI